MGSDWTVTTIGNLGRVVTGKTPSTKEKSNFRGRYPFITIPDLDGRRQIDTAARSLSDRGAASINSSMLPIGAVLMSCIATVGRCGVTTKPSFTNQQINSVIPNSNVDSNFLYYLFCNIGHDVTRMGGGGTTYTNVSKGRFSSIEVCIPTFIEEQRRIAAILGSLDDKIEANRKMAKTLEAIASAVFKSWFVDFDPVRAKIAGATSWPSMPQAAFDALPTGFAETEIGEVPEGWSSGPLSDLAALSTKSAKPNKEPEKTWTHFSIPAFDVDRHPTLDQGSEIASSKYQVRKDAVLVSKLNPRLWRCWRPSNHLLDDYAVCSTEFMQFLPLSVSRAYIWALANSERFKEAVERTVSGSTGSRQRAKPSDVITIKTVHPAQAQACSFDATVKPMLDMANSVMDENRTLAQTRDTLLPKLISGELRVEEAEEEMEAFA